ncbi:hypothetical protein CXG81DRAFT_9682 [Caulochytrium protostelioides]|uniref:ABC transporter domain-containing protein n=1 Tax=Caulochytrium protostelioides TaxID=1555241 RepID=A0A4P9XD04_9FUNG|nr:hypothetical protein CXG81DRAFT_9682 [Caulochytrium protostelioides]|eukprot:RKP03347.1 hypothetical protein CXG81DRAFT_9682 [Caulochytrium protostelioides]
MYIQYRHGAQVAQLKDQLRTRVLGQRTADAASLGGIDPAAKRPIQGGQPARVIDTKESKVKVDRRFLEQLRYIIRICIPRWRHKTTGLLVLHTVFLVLRTYMSVVVARLDGRLVKDLVNADGRSFLRGLLYWFAIAVPATYTNSMIRYLQSKLGIAFRTSLTKHVHCLYMENNTYYKALNLDKRIDGADQLITTDLNRFCTALAGLYSNLGKPLLDLIIFNYQLARSVGVRGMWLLVVNYLVTASLLRAVTPSFGALAAKEAKFEGDFRSAHSRLITNAEEVAFYNGADRERSILDRTYQRLIKHINSIYKIRIGYNMFEDFLIKYSWSAVGLLIASIPVFLPDWAGGRTKREAARLPRAAAAAAAASAATSVRTQGFITNKRLLMSLADAGGRVMYSYKELSELAGYTFRVYNMMIVLEDLRHDRYAVTGADAHAFRLDRIKGVMAVDNQTIKFARIPIVTPSGETCLVKDLSFEVKPGDHLMVTGPNGAGKSAILRVLAGIWPQFAGTLVRPAFGLEHVLSIPQRPYLTLGSLRDQVIYPDTCDAMRAKGKTDADLEAILKLVYLDYILPREGGWDTVKEWKDVFSGGEKQRVQLARLFYHRPTFAVLDEATSAVSSDVEALLYEHAKDAGTTLVTISHRPSLFKYHQLLLRVGETDAAAGELDWELTRIGSEDTTGHDLEAQIAELEKQLQKADAQKARLDAINRELRLVADAKPDVAAASSIRRTLL